MPVRKVLTCPSGKDAANAAERGVVFIGFYKKVLRAIARFYGFPSAEGSFKGV